jgi:hypothetical protein
MGRTCNTHEIETFTMFGRKTEGNRPPGRSELRLKGNIKMNLKEAGWETVDWIHLVQNRDQ